MQINSNITALVTNNALLRNESAFSLSTGKLSSGYKINTAGDDPTGYAISGRMRMQLEALKRADTNATTGKSVLETADGALSEVTDMLQRLNELAIKASNGTMSASDRADVQQEVDQLTAEIQRISDQIELNGQKLLDGHLENHGYCEMAKLVGKPGDNVGKYIGVEEYNDKVSAGEITLTQFKEEMIGNELHITIVGFPSEGDSLGGWDKGDPPDPDPTHWNAKPVKLDIPKYYENEAADADSEHRAVSEARFVSNDGRLSVKICDYDYANKTSGDQYITMKGINGEELTLKVDGRAIDRVESSVSKEGQSYELNKYSFDFSTKVEDDQVKLTLTGEGAMNLHVGANEEEVISCSLPRISLERLDIDNLSVKTQSSAQYSIDRVTYALKYVSTARSQIGAYTNRVEHSISYLAASNENLTSAMSRIQDTDMAEEMTNYASQQILVQAATSMLAQANQAPQQALQLIQ